MDGALSRLGIEENDIDEVVLGWTPRQPRDPWAPPDAPAAEKKEDANERTDPPPTELSGLLAGRFDQVRVSESAANNGLASIPIGAVQAYCPRLKAASVCLVVLSESLAAFGEPGALNRLLEVRAGKQNSLGVDHNFNRLINEVDKYAPIWGIATGTTVPEWFLGWMPGPTYAHVDLKKMFDGVQAFTYSIAVGEKLDLTARLNGETVEVAQRLRQFFSGLRILLSLFWQAQSPSQPSPFAGLEVSTEGRVCALRLTGTIEEVLLYQNSPMHSPVPGI